MSPKNPFPGMNPFMEQAWPDVRLSLIAFILEWLGTALPEDLQAKGEMRVDVRGGDSEHYRPDVAITEDGWKQGLPPVWTPDAAAGSVAVTEPALLMAEDEPQRWVEIRSDQGDLITVIEVLSPANKTTTRRSYLAKRSDLLHAGVNMVEIDLLRQGERTINVEGTNYDARFREVGDHYATCVTRPTIPGRREVYVSGLRQPLPTIRVPLRVTDPDVPLNLQSLVDRCYTTGRYWKADYALARLNPDHAIEGRQGSCLLAMARDGRAWQNHPHGGSAH